MFLKFKILYPVLVKQKLYSIQIDFIKFVFIEQDPPLSFPSLPKPKNQKKAKNEKKETQSKKEEKTKDGLKRGQKSKLKKIKMKYKDQDEEDLQAHLEAMKVVVTIFLLWHRLKPR